MESSSILISLIWNIIIHQAQWVFSILSTPLMWLKSTSRLSKIDATVWSHALYPALNVVKMKREISSLMNQAQPASSGPKTWNFINKSSSCLNHPWKSYQDQRYWVLIRISYHWDCWTTLAKKTFSKCNLTDFCCSNKMELFMSCFPKAFASKGRLWKLLHGKLFQEVWTLTSWVGLHPENLWFVETPQKNNWNPLQVKVPHNSSSGPNVSSSLTRTKIGK